ncbi:unnamed protein product, partial [Scytosiphon promiscuus]
GGKVKKKAATQRQLDATPLSEAHNRMMELFTAVDHAYCFLIKNSIPPRVASLQSLVFRLFPGRFGDEASFLPRLKEIADIARAVLLLEEPPEGDGGGDGGVEDEFQAAEPPTEARRLELRFLQKNTAGTGKAKVSRRLQLVRRAMVEHSEGRARRPPDGGDADEGDGGGDGAPAAPGSGESGKGSSGTRAGKKSLVAAPQATEGPPKEYAEVGDGGSGKARGRGGVSKTGAVAVAAEAAAAVAAAAAAENGGSRSNTGRPVGTGARGRRPPAAATGTALSLLGPLRDSPAYVVVRGGGGGGGGENGAGSTRNREGVDKAEAASATAGVRVGRPGQDVPATARAGASADKRSGAGSARASRISSGQEGGQVGEGGGGEEERDAGATAAATGVGDRCVVEKLRFDPLRALDYLKSLPIYEGQAVFTETLPGRDGEFSDTLQPLHPEVTAALAASKGVTRLFKHQALAIDAAAAGQHVALSTATSSGKSVVFNVAVIEAIVGRRPDAVALYLFPTKALAQDQLRSLKGLVGASPFLSERVRPMTLDGDTPFGERGVVAEDANIILTNPDMLHASVLPGHKRFRRILGNLSHVVIDEAHVYRGAFGAHVSMVLRRLLRLWSVNAEPGPPPQ